ncbi:hypothetical protein [Limosilactobacillus mucosae]|uniref:Uncharacterized protein n=1 Tax=Limosilactobacillus mucosae TaxID=97478 RepID=A0A508YPB4_LIMMU|nr:hypothetical protein [Limosilactobacillus mucosae]VTZ90331.1 hypothetical protein LMUP508_01125 [Limosilactobacillus mucosae]
MEIKTAEQMFHNDELVTIPGTHQLYKIVEINLNNGDVMLERYYLENGKTVSTKLPLELYSANQIEKPVSL